MRRYNLGFAFVLLASQAALGSVLTNGVDGINVPAGLNGSGITIGQVEPDRPGDPSFDTNGALFNSTVDPQGVFYRQPGPPMTFNPTLMNAAAETGNGHAVRVAGMMISTDATLKGVSPNAALYSVGDNGTPPISTLSRQFLLSFSFPNHPSLCAP